MEAKVKLDYQKKARAQMENVMMLLQSACDALNDEAFDVADNLWRQVGSDYQSVRIKLGLLR